MDIIFNHLCIELKIYDLQNLDINAATTRRNDIKEKKAWKPVEFCTAFKNDPFFRRCL